MNIATVFSGIGAPEYALKTYFPALKPRIVFACDCGETKPLDDEIVARIKSLKGNIARQKAANEAYGKIRKEHWIKKVYIANYASIGADDKKWYDDIRFLDGNEYAGKVDIFVGGSPCQSFSNMGRRKGLEDVRGTLFYDYARLIKEIKPKVFIYENVPGMLSRDQGRVWETIKCVFAQLGYGVAFNVLNSADCGIPQARRRLFVVGFKNAKFLNSFSFPQPIPLLKFAPEFYETRIPSKYYLTQKGFEFVTTHPGRAKINSQIIRTEKRNQEFNWNGDFVFERLNNISDKGILQRAFVGKYEGVDGVIRKLTPRECFRLMGFKDDFIICSNDTQAYMQSGNAIVVDVLALLFASIFKTGIIFNE